MTEGEPSRRRLRPVMPRGRDQVLFWGLVVAAVAADLWSKAAVFARVRTGDAIVLIPGLLQLIRAENAGAAFSLAQGRQPFLIAVGIVAWIVVVTVFYGHRDHPRLSVIALGLFAGGILGNLYDRLFNGGLVRDFIDAHWQGHHFPTFNVADSLLCSAVGLLMLSGFIQDRRRPRRDPPRTEACPSPPPGRSRRTDASR